MGEFAGPEETNCFGLLFAGRSGPIWVHVPPLSVVTYTRHVGVLSLVSRAYRWLPNWAPRMFPNGGSTPGGRFRLPWLPMLSLFVKILAEMTLFS